MRSATSRSRSSQALTAAWPHPCELQVRSIDVVFMRALQTSVFDARVHSVFGRVVNLERAAGELFTLAACTIDNAPLTAIVDVIGFDAFDIAVSDPVTMVDGVLHVGGVLALNLTVASRWQATLPTYAATLVETSEPGSDRVSERLARHLRIARAYLTQEGVCSGMSKPAGTADPFALEIAAALEQRSMWMLDALAQARHADACRHAVSMLGLGPGLTPSGDDFLVGLFAVCNVAGSPCHGWLGGGTQVLLQAEHATNAISLSALTAAAGGGVRQSIATLIEALLHGTPATLIDALRRVLAIGATSGADMVAGILAGLELNLRVDQGFSRASAPTTTVSTGEPGS